MVLSRSLSFAFPLALFSSVAVVACSSSNTSTPAPGPANAIEAGTFSDAAPDASVEAPHVDPRPADAGYPFDGGTLRADRFITKVVSFTEGGCAGFGKSGMPDIVFGPPHGAGDLAGGLDVVSLGDGGEIVLGFDNAIIDGPGDDFVVFENAFFAGGDQSRPAADTGEVSVSEDGTNWKTFPCTATTTPYGACAGWHPVYSSPENGILPTDPAAGGDRYDLSTLGVAKAKFVKIRDVKSSTCDANVHAVNMGFDLDAIVIVNAEKP